MNGYRLLGRGAVYTGLNLPIFYSLGIYLPDYMVSYRTRQ